jgi:hypothetical protein
VVLSAATIRTQMDADRAMQFSLPVVDVHGGSLPDWLEICMTMVLQSTLHFTMVTASAALEQSDSDFEENAGHEFSVPAAVSRRTRSPLTRAPRLMNAAGDGPRPSRASGSIPGAGVGDWTVTASPIEETCPADSPSSLGVETCSAESLEDGASPMSAETERQEASEIAAKLFPPPVEMPLAPGDAESQGEDSSHLGEKEARGTRGNALVEEAAAEAEGVLTSAGALPMEERTEAMEVQTSTGQAVVPIVAGGAAQWNGLDFTDLLESLDRQEADLLANQPQRPGGELAVLRYGFDIATRTYPAGQIFDNGPGTDTIQLAGRAYGAAQIWCRTVERGLEQMERNPRSNQPSLLERQRGILMLADLVRQFLDIVRGGKMVHFMLVAHGQQQGWVPYMHDEPANSNAPRSVYLWVKDALDPGKTFPYWSVIHALVQNTATALERAGFLAKVQSDASKIVLRSPRAEAREANARVVSRCVDLLGDVCSWQSAKLWRGYNSSLMLLSQIDHPRRLIWKDGLDVAMPLWRGMAFDIQESPRLSVWAQAKGQFVYVLRMEESDRLGLYKIPGTSVAHRTLEGELQRHRRPDVPAEPRTEAGERQQQGRQDVKEPPGVHEEQIINNGQNFEMAQGSETRTIDQIWDGYTLKSGIFVEAQGSEQALVLVLHKPGDRRGMDGLYPVVSMTLVRLSTFPKADILARLGVRVRGPMVRGERMPPPLVMQAWADARTRAASETRGPDQWAPRQWWGAGSWRNEDVAWRQQ